MVRRRGASLGWVGCSGNNSDAGGDWAKAIEAIVTPDKTYRINPFILAPKNSNERIPTEHIQRTIYKYSVVEAPSTESGCN